MAAGPTYGLTAYFWRLFASIRLALVLIFTLAVVSVLGSLIPQEGVYPSALPPDIYYPTVHGTFGEVMYVLGFTRMYTSWWFVTLLVLGGINLTVCSLERVVPLLRSVRRPKVTRSDRFITSRPVQQAFRLDRPSDEALGAVATLLRRRRFAVSREGANLYADKGRLGRYGPYITHIGLMLLLVAALSRSVPGWYHEESFWIEDGETILVPGTDYYIRSEGFDLAFYDDGRPQHFQTDVVVIDGGQEVLTYPIRVNHPLVYERTNVFQTTYQLELGEVAFQMYDLANDPRGEYAGLLEIDVQDPKEAYTVGSISIKVLQYFPDLHIDPDEGPVNQSADPNNPAFLLEIQRPGGGEPVRHWLFASQPGFIPPGITSPYRFRLHDLQVVRRSGLTARKNLALPFIYFGMSVTVLGVGLSFYIFHRRLWVSVDGERLLVGAMCNKHLTSLRREMDRIFTEIEEAAGASVEHPVKGEPSTA